MCCYVGLYSIYSSFASKSIKSTHLLGDFAAMRWPPRFIRRWFLHLDMWWHWILKLTGMVRTFHMMPYMVYIWKIQKQINWSKLVFRSLVGTPQSVIVSSKTLCHIFLRFGMRNHEKSAWVSCKEYPCRPSLFRLHFSWTPRHLPQWEQK